MTNAEKYLITDAGTFLKKLTYWEQTKHQETRFDKVNINELREFLLAPVQPTLTEDERAILRNIKNADFGNYIGRGDSLIENTPTYYNLYLRGNHESKSYAIGTIYNHLFQFIKEGEEYSIEELLKGE